MPEEFDPTWEYYSPSEEILELDDVHTRSTLGRFGFDYRYGRQPFAPYIKGGWNVGVRVTKTHPDSRFFDPSPKAFEIKNTEKTSRVRKRLQCQKCGNGFDTKSGYRQIYCFVCLPVTGRCPISMAVCCGCGKDFKPTHRRYFRYCSKECGGRSVKKDKLFETGCPICGGEVIKSGKGNSKAKVYCGRKCMMVHRSRKYRARKAGQE